MLDEQDEIGSSPGDIRETSFTGDEGSLRYDTRRVLTQLLLGPYVDGTVHINQWVVLLRDEAILKSRLNDMFLDLLVDHDQKIAFVRQITSDESDIPVLLRRTPLKMLDSALVIYLRKRLIQSDTQGDRCVVDLDEMRNHLLAYEPTENTDGAKFDNLIQGSIERMKKLAVLKKLKGGEERYEISPILKTLFGAEEIQSLMTVYTELANGKLTPAAVNSIQTGDSNDDE